MEKLIQKRINKTKSFAGLLQTAPFVSAIILNGSLAIGNIKESSDIDLLIITKKGRIFTTRFFVNLIGILTGQKRPKNEKKSHAGKFCFNYFTTEDYLKIPMGRGEKIDKYCAENYSKSILISGDQQLFKRFFEVNKELFTKHCSVIARSRSNEAIYHERLPRLDSSSKSMAPTSPSYEGHGRDDRHLIIRKILESILITKFGDWLEKRLKTYQIAKIESDSRTQQYPNLITYNDRELRFHPPK